MSERNDDQIIEKRFAELEARIEFLEKGKNELSKLVNRIGKIVGKLAQLHEKEIFIPLENELKDIEDRMKRCPSK